MAAIYEKIINYIDEHIKEEITIDEVAKFVGYAPCHVYKIFKFNTSVPIMEYIRRKKLNIAANEICSGKKLYDIALDCGYETQAGFYKAFQGVFGCSPSAYKNKNYGLRGEIFMNTEIEKEIEELTQKIESEPDNAAFYDKRAEAYRKSGEYDKMINAALKSLELEPENSEYLMSYGNALSWIENYEEAIQYLTKAIERDSLKPYYYICRGNCYQRLNEKIIKSGDEQNRDGYKKSLEDYDKAIEFDPENAFYYYCRGVAYDWLGDSKSHEDYQKAFELQPDNMDYLKQATSQEILIYFGYALLPCLENDIVYTKFINLRENLKTEFNAYMPVLTLKDNQNINPYEIIVYIDEKVVFKQEHLKEKVNNENIIDEVIDFLRKIYSEKYVKTA